tara:strand:- start:474 stop:1466 length:993 start_codon:yes stop_codon:yes gene_type:complete
MADKIVYPAPTRSELGGESSLSNWVGPYVSNMLGRGMALSNQPYTAYTGDLTPGPNALQQQAYTGIAGLGKDASGTSTLNMGEYAPQSFTGTLDESYNVTDPSTGAQMLGASGQPVTNNTVAGQYMNPYLQQALTPQIDELRRQQEISRLGDANRLTKAGAYGGSRQAIMEAEGNRNLLSQIDRTQSQGYMDAYNQAQDQFNTEEDRRRAAQTYNNEYGLSVLDTQRATGDMQRGFTAEGIAADRAQFEAEKNYPYKQVQYLQSLLQELPLEAQSKVYSDVDPVSAGISSSGGILGLLGDIFKVFPSSDKEEKKEEETSIPPSNDPGLLI